MGPSSPRLPPGPGTALRRRLAKRLGQRLAHAASARPVHLSGGRSAATIRLGKGPGAMVVKITAATRPTPPQHSSGPVDTAPPRHQRQGTSAPPPKPSCLAQTAGRDRPMGPGGVLFAVDPLLEGQLMRALARRGLAPMPTALFRHGPHVCLAYPYQRGHTGHPPDGALGRLLRRLHGLPPAALPPLPPPQDRGDLVAWARQRVQHEPDGRLLVARIDAAVQAARQMRLPHGPVPLHGDPVPGNVLHGRQGVRLIDWHSAHRGDPCHDLAIALSPAMQVIHGLPPCTPRQRATVLSGYGCLATTDRLAATAALHHARMIGHCLWRLDRGDTAYGPACTAEIAAIRALP